MMEQQIVEPQMKMFERPHHAGVINQHWFNSLVNVIDCHEDEFDNRRYMVYDMPNS